MNFDPTMTSPIVDSAADIGRAVRSRRNILRLKQEELACLAGVGRRFIVDLEAGKPSIQLDSLFRVLNAVDIEAALKFSTSP